MGKWGTGIVKFNCKFCGREFEAQKSSLRQYCSRECVTESSIKHPLKNCAVCGKPLLSGKRKYCSTKCSGLNRRKTSPENCERQRKYRKNFLKVKNGDKFSFINKSLFTVIYECRCTKAHKENHHFDYSKPTTVIRLCKKCHAAEHTRLRRLAKSASAVAI